MQHENSFSVSRFKNRNGVFSFRVDGYLNGNRIRRNFKTREEAAAEQAARGQPITARLTLFPVRDRDKVVGGVIILELLTLTAATP